MTDSKNAYGVVRHTDIVGRTDHLFRLSLKALVFNDKHEVLLVKEVAGDDWDIPGGGMDHGESFRDALQRELVEEVSLSGGFEYQVISAESPKFVENINLWQARIIFAVWPKNTIFSPGEDSEEIRFASIDSLKQSKLANENIYASHAERAIKLRSQSNY